MVAHWYTALERLGVIHASEVAEAERRLVGAGFRYPDDLLHHTNKYELCSNDFGVFEYGAILCILIEAELREWTPTLGLVYQCLCQLGHSPHLNADGYPEELARLLLYTEITPTGIPRNVEIVATFARHRRQAQECIKKAEALLFGDISWLEGSEASGNVTTTVSARRHRRKKAWRRRVA